MSQITTLGIPAQHSADSVSTTSLTGSVSLQPKIVRNGEDKKDCLHDWVNGERAAGTVNWSFRVGNPHQGNARTTSNNPPTYKDPLANNQSNAFGVQKQPTRVSQPSYTAPMHTPETRTDAQPVYQYVPPPPPPPKYEMLTSEYLNFTVELIRGITASPYRTVLSALTASEFR